MQLEHPMMAHQKEKEVSQKEMPVHTVMSPEDEALLYAQQMAETEQAFVEQLSQPASTPSKSQAALTDAILDREMKKKDVFNKIVMLKEDHFTEVKLAGLTFKLKLLNSIDNSFIMKEVQHEPQEDRLPALTLMVLAAAIVDIDGVLFEEFYTGPSNIEHPVLKKYFELKQWQQPVLNALQKAYNKFQSSVESQYTKDFLD